MPEELTKPKPVAASRPAVEDLSKEIERSVEREPNDNVRSVRVFDNCYRCNWWVQDKHPNQLWLSTGKIRKSRLLRVTRTGEQLLVEDIGETR